MKRVKHKGHSSGNLFCQGHSALFLKEGSFPVNECKV